MFCNSLTGRLSHVETTVGLTDTIQDIYYTYDAAGNILEINDASTPYGKTTTYTYDHLNRLLTAQCQSSSDDLCQGFTSPVTYTYNPIGNITYNSRVGTYTYSTDHPHAVQQAGPTTYTYDNNGNLQTKVAGGNTTTFTFNDDNRLASIAQNGVTLSCVYDHQGNRVKKTYGGSTTVYIGNLYEVTDGVATKHIFAGGTRVASIRSTIRFTLHKDHLGGLNFATNANGSVAQHDEYMPFGETRLETGTADLHHKFTDQEEDSEFGLYYYGARYYDPIIGRFISPDSIVQAPQDPQTLNRYSYCRNNPLKYTDPNGHSFLGDLFKIFLGAFLSFFVGPIVSGAVMGGISGGSEGALMGAMTGAAFAMGNIVASGIPHGQEFLFAAGTAYTVGRYGPKGLAYVGAGMIGNMAAQESLDLANYLQTNADPPKAESGNSGDCTTVVITYDYGIGTHSAVQVDNSGNPVLYDPGGSYLTETRGSGNYFTEEEANLDSYVEYQKGTGSTVRTFKFNTSAQEESIIASRIQNAPDPGFLGCSRGVSTVLSGVGPFKNLPIYQRPGSLADALEVLQNTQKN